MEPNYDELRALNGFWSEETCGALVKHQTPVVLSSSMTIAQAVDTLAKHDILSALVVNDSTTTTPASENGAARGDDKSEPNASSQTHHPKPVADSRAYMGMFSVRALLQVFLKDSPADFNDNNDINNSSNKSIKPSVTIAQDIVGKSFPTLYDLCTAHTPSFLAVLSTDALSEAVRFFANGTHRCSVLNSSSSTRTTIGTLSQSIVLKYVLTNINNPTIDAIMKRSVHDVFAVASVRAARGGGVLSVRETERVRDAVSLMMEHDITSVAVLDESGCLCGSLSMSDMKYTLKAKRQDALYWNVHDFMRALRENQSIAERGARDAFPYFATRMEKTLGSVVEKMVATRVHRLWIIDDSRHAIGVISMTDIMRILAPLSVSVDNADSLL